MNTIKRNSTIKGKHEKPIVTDLYFQQNASTKPIVLFCHGYKGFKDWGPWDLVAKKFSASGFFFIKFNFSHNGTTPENPTDFGDLDAFGHNNYSKELDDLQSVIDWVKADTFPYKNEVDTSKINLIGHSRGGGIVLLKSAEEPSVSTVTTWAGVADFKERFVEGNALKEWKGTGVFYVLNGRTKQQMPHYYQFYKDFVAHESRLTISKAVASLKIPHLIIHGTADPTVQFDDAKKLENWNDMSTLIPIEGANHVFGGSHPWKIDQLPEQLQKVVSESITFLSSNEMHV